MMNHNTTDTVNKNGVASNDTMEIDSTTSHAPSLHNELIAVPVLLVPMEAGDAEHESPGVAVGEERCDNKKESNALSNNFDGGNHDPNRNGLSDIPSSITLKLDESEMKLFRTINEATQALERGEISIPSRPNLRNIQVRVAGGWVRDKILNLQSHDVDIALDTCTGVEFATLVQQYVTAKQKKTEKEQPEDKDAESKATAIASRAAPNGNEHNKDKKKSKPARIAVIAANPNQSKHLETATTKIHGLEIDFANLRHEAYTDDSRIPTVQLGTPSQDAHRRDFTMNSLFLNLHTMVIEDYTCRGLIDLLFSKKVTTPLPAIETFQDDPLRVLRAIRFAVRFQYTLDIELENAARNENIHAALHVKVSRERVGKELIGMLHGKGANPKKAFQLINRLHLAGSVFLAPSPVGRNIIQGTIGIKNPIIYPPSPSEKLLASSAASLTSAGATTTDDAGGGDGSTFGGFRPSSRNSNASGSSVSSDYSIDEEQEHAAATIRAQVWDEGRDCLDEVQAVLDELQKNSATTTPGTTYDEPLVFMAVFLLPYYKLAYADNKKKNVQKLVVEYMVREGIKFKNTDVQAMVTIMQNVTTMCELLRHEPPPPRPPTLLAASATDMDVDSPENEAALLWKQIRLQTGMFIRSTKGLWVSTMIVATVFWIRCQQREEEEQQQTALSTPSSMITMTPNQIRERARQWHEAIFNNLELDHCWTIKALLNGKEVSTLLNVPKGPLVGVYTQQMIEWMLMNPDGTREDCLAYFKEQNVQQQLQNCEQVQELAEKASLRRDQRQHQHQHRHQQHHIHKKAHLSPP